MGKENTTNRHPHSTHEGHMNKPRILLLGVGNILYTDEGLGVHAVRLLQEGWTFSDNIELMDGGTLGKLLMAPIMDCDELIVLDAVLGGEKPGSIYRLEDEGLRKSLGFRDSQHQVDLVDTLISCEMAGHRPHAVVMGVEPEDWKTMGMEIGSTVKAVMPRYLELVLKELAAVGGTAEAKP